jgi:hypothetical protein
MNEPTDIKRRYRQFADRECKGYSDVYYGLAVAVSEDDDVVSFIAGMPVVQPNLFLASIQLLTGPDSMPKTGSELRAFLKRRGREVAAVMRSHRTQTNEVGRCAVLLPALPSGPLALVEVGASAGLCLLLDQFYYEFGSTAIGEVSSPVHLRCTVVGPAPLPPAVPHVVWMLIRSVCMTIMQSDGCSLAFGRIIVSVDDDSKVRSTWPGPSLWLSVLATWSMIFPRCWPRHRTTPSSLYSTPPY